MTRSLPDSLKGCAWLRAGPLQAVLAVLGADIGEARIAGGAVRDALLGEQVQDIDIATAHAPDVVTARAERAGFAVHPTGIDHGTVTIVVHEDDTPHPFEVTTLRIDAETHGRHATVKFTADWAADAARRDFTINALYCNADGTIHDPVGGLADLAHGRVRFVGDAVTRIREDYLRILRFFRFHARFGTGEPDRQGLAACTQERDGLKRLSIERISSELLKTLSAPGAAAVLPVMNDAGILSMVLSTSPDIARLERMIAIDQANALDADAILRLAALTGPDPDLGAALRLSNREIKRLEMMSQAPAVYPALKDSERKAQLYRLTPQTFSDTVRYQWAETDAEPTDPAWADLLHLADNWPVPVFPVTGADLMSRGHKPGPELGARLQVLEEQWITAGFPDDKGWILGQISTKDD
jgi:poly(A) polymerase